VFLTGRSTAGVAATAAATATVQRLGASASGGVGMFVATDQEGGQVQVLSGPGFTWLVKGDEMAARVPRRGDSPGVHDRGTGRCTVGPGRAGPGRAGLVGSTSACAWTFSRAPLD
jgi:hypothetical protein